MRNHEPEEVNAMTGKQLRIKAALLSGWEDVGEGDGIMLSGHPPKGWRPSRDEEAEENMRYRLPDYPNDIAAAMNDLVPRIISATYRSDGDADDIFAVCHFVSCLHGRGEPWAVRMVGEWCFHERHDSYFPIFTYISATSPEKAITRAFILAMTAEEE